MRRALLEARRYGHFTIRGVFYAQGLSARDELDVALIHLKRDARKAARAAISYLRSGGRADEHLSPEERKRVLGLIRAHVVSEVSELKQWQKARMDLGVIKGAAGTVPGRSSFSAPQRASESPSLLATIPNATALRAIAPEPSATAPRPPWFGLCRKSREYSLTLLARGLFSFGRSTFCSTT